MITPIKADLLEDRKLCLWTKKKQKCEGRRGGGVCTWQINMLSKKKIIRSPRVDFTWNHMLECGQISMSTLHPQENAESCNNKQGPVFYPTEISDPSAILSPRGFLDHPIESRNSEGKQEVVFSIPIKNGHPPGCESLPPVLTHYRLDLLWRKHPLLSSFKDLRNL